MLSENSPDFYFAFFHKDAPMDVVVFELGWLCGTLSVAQFSEKLILMAEYGYDFNQTTSYIARLPFRVKSIPFEESKKSPS
jgi:hypothetical protein